ncbi:MAG: MG2 domain-containing protein [Candidatus Sumerlaeota bacterium]|nr:MG2 domain-containing protein [Candidatus Sumerlaeota bacterium]
MKKVWVFLRHRAILGAIGIISIALGLLVAIAAQNKPTPVGEELTKLLGGENRYLGSVSTDKPIYKPGETVYVRAIVLHAMTRKPLAVNGWAQIEIISPKGDAIAQGSSNLQNSALGYKWTIDDSVAGGDYKVKVAFPSVGCPPAERSFNIRAYRQKRLRTQIEFAREGYGPGDEVSATLQATRSEGGIPAGAKAGVVARVDQAEAWRGEVKIDERGYATARFKLPQTIIEGDGTLSFAIEDGGVIETAAKTIPILVAKVDLKAYPEGGDLVAGFENRIYFEAIAPNGRPADVTVELRDSKGAALLTAKTEHEGRGSFVFTPQAGDAYVLQVIEPWIITTKADLPKATEGYILHALKDRFGPGEPLLVAVASAGQDAGIVLLSQRERKIAQGSPRLRSVTGKINPREIWYSFSIPKEICGVLRVTVYDGTGLPRAERLIYREPATKVKVAIEQDRTAYIPGEKTTLKIKTTDAATGKPAPGFVALTVTDDALLEMVEKREQAPRLPAQVFIESEVRELADAAVYLADDASTAIKGGAVKPSRALDLLLGTQGWRRFSFMKVEEFKKQYSDAARRVLAETIAPPPQPVTAAGGARFFGMMREGNARWAVEERVDNLALGDNVEKLKVAELDQKKAGKIEVAKMPARQPLAAVPPPALMPAPAAKPEPAKERPAGPKAKDMIAEKELAQRIAPEGKPAQAMGKLRRIAADELVVAGEALPAGWVVAREFAHAARPNRQPNDRVDFAETLYWSAAIATDNSGETSVTFDLSDSVTTFRAQADAYTNDGVLGSNDAVIESRRPFYVEAKAPLEVTAGDKVDMPIALINETDKPMDAVVVASANAGVTIGKFGDHVTLAPHSRMRVVVPATIKDQAGLSELVVTASSGEFTDNVTRTVPVRPLGFPIALSFGGMLEKEISHSITIPKSLTEGGMTAQLAVYPTPLGNLTKALEAMIRDPCGCFEQTSSSNYPLVMAMQYFTTHQGVDPALITRSREKLAAGYKRLTGYECKDKGYEWFGGDPGHEALTAYGLLEFNDMKDLQPVDPKMMERTREWLLKRRDGKGGFQKNPRALDSFGGAPDDITNAYITWALARAGEKDIVKELDAQRDAASKSEDPYLIALAAGALAETKRKDDAAPLLKHLAAMQDKDGSIKGAKTTITRSGGQSLLIETASLTVLAWLSDGAYAGAVEKAMKWLCKECEGGRFGSTQSTILALKAIVEYDKSRARPKSDGALVLSVDGKEIEKVAFTKDTDGALEFKKLGGALNPGEHKIALAMKDGSPMPYSLAIEYQAEKPADAAGCPLELVTRLATPQTIETRLATAQTIKEGDPVDVIARLRNTKDEGLPMTMAIIGLPGGLEPRHEQLKEAVKAGKFSFYEVRGRDVAIYYRALEPKAEREIVISCIAAAPGVYSGPASRAYLYYTPEEKKWCDPLKATITAK